MHAMDISRGGTAAVTLATAAIFACLSPSIDPSTQGLIELLERRNPSFKDTVANREILEYELLVIENRLHEFPAIHAVDGIVALIRVGELDIAEAALVGQAEAMVALGDYVAAQAIAGIVLRLNALELDTRQMAATEALLSALQASMTAQAPAAVAIASD